MMGFEPTTFRTPGGSSITEQHLGEQGHLLRSYKLVNRILCLKQTLTRHDLNISALFKNAILCLALVADLECIVLEDDRPIKLALLIAS